MLQPPNSPKIGVYKLLKIVVEEEHNLRKEKQTKIRKKGFEG